MSARDPESRRAFRIASVAVAGLAAAIPWGGAAAGEAPLPDLRKALDAPLLFVKRHSYTGIHIYDTYYKWPPGGGGIYVLENPAETGEAPRIRAVIDPSTPETLGVGVHTHPELSWDATRVLFCFKGEPEGSTSVYEIGVDGTGLRRLTDPGPSCADYKGTLSGQHDVAPAYLPDGRIVLASTRPSGLVPCNNTGVAILHVMEADGSGLRPISVNNVNEFDPSVLPDGRILYGRWEYIDKNALTIQSLWTILPDGSDETAIFANNMVLPEAVLDARPIPGTHRIVATFAKHNAPPRGSIAIMDPALGRDGAHAIHNLEHPEDPTRDTGESCEPWPVSDDVVLFSGRPAGHARNAIEIIDRAGRRQVILSDPDICLHSPMLVKPRPRPPVLPSRASPRERTGSFFVQDIYRGLEGVERGEVKWLRVIEETSRVSGSPRSPNPYNQTFLVSAALAFSVKNYLGVVPVAEDGSAWFEVPSGRAVYLQALDAEGRLVQSMRSFVQASPGVTRSCIGCHEHRASTPASDAAFARSLRGAPERLRPESWGSGFMDYPSMVQPVLDRNCVTCHGGRRGVNAGMDLSGGWTEHFSISYENLVSRRESQLTAHLISGIDCMNGTAFWSARIFPPRAHGSGAAPLAEVVVSGHHGRIPNLTRPERDLLLAWIDSNGLYHGTWDTTRHGFTLASWGRARETLVAEMRTAGCLRCHGDGDQVSHFENDWINLREPELSRILRAPLSRSSVPGGEESLGLGLCRDRKVDPARQRLRLLWGGYLHAVTPLEGFARLPAISWDDGWGEPFVSFASSDDPAYQRLLAAIRKAREEALATPRVDMPGAEAIAGACRQLVPPPVPRAAPALGATVEPSRGVRLSWERSAATIGLEAEIHRGTEARFAPGETTLIARTTLFAHVDRSPPPGHPWYALVLVSGDERSDPSYAEVRVPAPEAPENAETASVAPGR